METQSQDHFLSVTELAGDEVAAEQVQRLSDRYAWAASLCVNKDVVEVACGTGQGLGVLAKYAASVVGGDVSQAMVEKAIKHYGTRLQILNFDATRMPFADASKDVIIIFEAIYYLPDVEAFLLECKRVLRPSGYLLIATANKDLFDFNPSPYSHKYFGVVELGAVLRKFGFTFEMYGNTPVSKVSMRQKILCPVKKVARDFNLIPKTMGGKKFLKKLMFGELVAMPDEVAVDDTASVQLKSLDSNVPDRAHKVIFCSAKTSMDV